MQQNIFIEGQVLALIRSCFCKKWTERGPNSFPLMGATRVLTHDIDCICCNNPKFSQNDAFESTVVW